MGQDRNEQDVKEGTDPDFSGCGEAKRDVLLQEKPAERNSADSQSLVKKPKRSCSFVRGGY